ncbi:hypothetical protein FRX31_031163 [Thalictrum thalictroides]|uniref:Uncharacterized protein n=1 Tax=Thalictrum thalictroides TaxID=46969 RepID=A0A7J6V2K9_THATH|nr:hypothetical protein FRX31_031163 [Thalictrum thalictroides]
MLPENWLPQKAMQSGLPSEYSTRIHIYFQNNAGDNCNCSVYISLAGANCHVFNGDSNTWDIGIGLRPCITSRLKPPTI